MNILLTIHDPKIISGYTLVPRYLAVEFKRLGHKVKILCLHKPSRYLADESADMYLTGNLLSHAVAFNLNDKIKQFKPDIIYTHGMFPSDSLATKYAKKYAVPIFTTVHTKLDEFVKFYIADTLFTNWIVDLISQKYVKFLHAATKVFALTQEMEDYLNDLGIKRTSIIGNGVDLDTFKPSSQNLLAKDEYHLLYVGSIQSRKNQLYLFDVARHLPNNIKIHIVGGPTFDQIYFLNFIKELKLNKPQNLIYDEELTPIQVAELMQKSVLYIASSLLEAQSLSQLEACACCLPTVRLLGKHTQGITADGYNAIHLNEKASPQEFAKNIIDLLQDKNKYNLLRSNLLKDRQNLSWHLPAKLLISEFSKKTVKT